VIDKRQGTSIIEKFDIPETFIAVTSSLFLILRKNQIPDNKTINGNILYKKLGTIIKERVNGTTIPTLKSLKKLISSKTFIIKPKQKIIKNVFKITLKNSLPIYLFITKDLSIIFKQGFHI
tara:strand:- start:1182 stop:1544 length:363 start_codon:yes stop_codon:yes gene_type:complete